MQAPLFECQHLVKRYGNATVVDDLSFQLQAGECLGVIGPNGAGKTTTLRMCLGLSEPDAGSIQAFGLSMPRDALAIKSRLGVVSQFDTLDPDFTCAENLRVFGTYFGMPRSAIEARVPELLEFAALTHKADAKPGQLSGGMKRRLSLARALINDPDILLLDEPAAGMSAQDVDRMTEIIHELNRFAAAAIVEHDMQFIRSIAETVTVFHQGAVLMEDHVDRVMSDPQVRAVYLGKKA